MVFWCCFICYCSFVVVRHVVAIDINIVHRVVVAECCLPGVKRVNVRSYIAQYLILRIAQSALLLTSLRDPFQSEDDRILANLYQLLLLCL